MCSVQYWSSSGPQRSNNLNPIPSIVFANILNHIPNFHVPQRSNQRNKSRTLQVQEELPEEQEAEEDDEEPGVKRRRSSITVRRNRRVSAEAYPTLLCEDIMRELHGLDSSNSDNDDVFDALDLGEVNDDDEDEDDDLLMDADELKALKDELFG